MCATQETKSQTREGKCQGEGKGEEREGRGSEGEREGDGPGEVVERGEKVVTTEHCQTVRGHAHNKVHIRDILTDTQTERERE